MIVEERHQLPSPLFKSCNQTGKHIAKIAILGAFFNLQIHYCDGGNFQQNKVCRTDIRTVPLCYCSAIRIQIRLFVSCNDGVSTTSYCRLQITETDKAVLSLKSQRKKLDEQRKRVGVVTRWPPQFGFVCLQLRILTDSTFPIQLETLIEREKTVARNLVQAGRKDRALLALRKKKAQEEQMSTLDGLIVNVEQVLANINIAVQQNQVFAVLQEGTKQLKELQKKVTLDEIEKLLADNEEAKEYQEMLQNALAQDVSLNEEAVQDDFERLLAEEAMKTAELLPSAPTSKISSSEKVQEEEQLPSVPSGPSVISIKQRTGNEEEAPMLAA